MRHCFLLLILSCVFTSHNAQYLQLRQQGREHRGYGFNSRFQGQPLSSFELKDLHLYKDKKVSKVMIFSNDSILLQTTELDRRGDIIREGNYDGVYFQVRSYTANNPSVSSTTYYLQNRLIRTDTSIHTGIEYKKNDTLFLYNRSERYEFKTGELLNQQNRYYNEQYYRKRFRVNPKGSHVIYLNRLRMKRHYMVFLKKRFPVDFDSLKVYPASIGNHATFYAQKGNALIDTTALRTHPFFKRYHPIQKTIYLVPGQSFQEPSFDYGMDDRWACGNGYIKDDYPTFESHDWTYNEKGLPETYFSRFFPQDKDPAAIAEYKIQNEKFINNRALNSNNYDSYMPRQKTPIITRIYFVRYEYFN